ncbi:MAG: methylcrotonoyl-CoA carboxylase [Ignavibacteria bacterium RIFCSPLOWO2_02_FULL_55_14]|nr:MAG: methylcrotonoyl-CoA carboxylase [Ignavibacteria bacterium RIFCSPLOWO2_02_FULL_55_14]
MPPHDKSVQSSRNAEHMQALLKRIRTEGDRVKLGGGPDAHAKQRAKGKLSARERIERLLDPGTKFLEVGLFAAHGMYEEYGGAPSSGTVFGIGTVHGRDVVIVANDATVKAGAWFPITAKKNLRAQEIAMENRLPIVYLVDSAGVFLPLQAEIFPDKEHFGRIFRNNAVMSSIGIPQIAVIMGPCVAGGAYLPIMSDEAMIVEKTGSVFLAGAHLVKAAIGEEIDNEKLGGADVHSEISGVTDHKMKDDAAALEKVRSIISKLGTKPAAPFNRTEPKAPKHEPKEVYGLLPADRAKPYDMYEVLDCIVDDGSWDEYKADYGKTIITGYARVDGWAVGIVANQRAVVRNAKGEMQVGGVIYSDSADKGARFIMNCNQKLIPLVFFQDVTGFMVGSRAEQGGIIKDGAKMVNAVANSVVPKLTFIVGNSYGAGNYAMCGKAYDPRLIFAWPSAQIAVMGGKQSSETLLAIKVQQMEKGGKHISAKEQAALLKEIQDRYESQLDPLYAAARLWVDGVIDPADTREVISRGLRMAAHNPDIPRFNPGVIQT